MALQLLQLIATAISTAPIGETYEDCRNNEAKAVLEAIADRLDEDRIIFITAFQLHREANKLKENQKE